MQFRQITSQSTVPVKLGSGYVGGILVVNAGSSWTMQVYDVANAAATPANFIIGATAMTVPAAGTYLRLQCHFTNGLIVKTAGGTAGEITITYY